MNPILRDFPDYIETGRLLIRAPRPGDGRALYDAVMQSLDELKPWMPWAHQPITLEAEEGIARRMHAEFLTRENLPLFVFLKDSPVLIGGSGLHRFDWSVPRFEIGYWLRTGYTGKGYMTEAVAGITHFAFETLFAERVEIRMDDRNARSYRIAERLHFQLEGILRNEARGVAGELRNTRVYSLIRDEWLSRQEQQA